MSEGMSFIKGVLGAGSLAAATISLVNVWRLQSEEDKGEKLLQEAGWTPAPVQPVVPKEIVDTTNSVPFCVRAFEKTVKSVDGAAAVDYVCYLMNDIAMVVMKETERPAYRCLGDDTAQSAASGKKNILGEGRVGENWTVVHPQGHGSALLKKLADGLSVSVHVTEGPCLLEMIPLMYQLVDKRLPCVIHAFPGSVASDLSCTLRFDDVMATRQTGLGFLISQSVAECQAMAIVAHFAATRARLPFVHLLESAYQVDESVELLSSDKLKELLNSISLSSAEDSKQGEQEEKEESKKAEELYHRSGGGVDNVHVAEVVDDVMVSLQVALGKRYGLFEYVGDENPKHVIVAMGVAAAAAEEGLKALPRKQREGKGVLKVRLFKPWSYKHFLAALPTSVERLSVIDHMRKGEDTSAEEFGPLFLEVVMTVQQLSSSPEQTPPDVASHYYSSNKLTADMAAAVFITGTGHTKGVQQLMTSAPAGSVSVAPLTKVELAAKDEQVAPETAYVKVLNQTFGEHLVISNEEKQKESKGEGMTLGNIEFGYGSLLSQLQQRTQLVNAVTAFLAELPDVLDNLDDEETTHRLSTLADLLHDWLSKRDGSACNKLAASISKLLDQDAHSQNPSSSLDTVHRFRHLFHKSSSWLIGGSEWAHDVSYSGVHHVVSSKQNVNLLIVDTEVYTTAIPERADWKKDIGLYAMNYGGVYVASCALYSSYTQVLQAMMEADAYPGPAIVLAYSPQFPNPGPRSTLALEQMKETKRAVAIGKWPLYRWNPRAGTQEGSQSAQQFTLDSQFIKTELETFLSRDNHLSLLARRVPEISQALAGHLGRELQTGHKEKQSETVSSYMKLLKGLKNSQPVMFIYGSDGGHAEGVAKRLHVDALHRGLDASCLVMDDVAVSDLAAEPNVVAVVSTAGQGEFPGNAKTFWANLCADSDPGALSTTKTAVFGLGDSHYWPDEIEYFAQAARELAEKFAEIGSEQLCETVFGDDQDVDGYETGMAKFEEGLWEALGVSGASSGKTEVLGDDQLKDESNYLRGTISESLLDTSTGGIPYIDTKLTKFHGIYQQDDRDLREARRQEGLENAFSFMIRVRSPGGLISAAQYLAMDHLGTTAGNGGLKITTRQAFQLHGVIKRELKGTIANINKALMDTLAACGDVCRNIMISPVPPPHCPQETFEQIHTIFQEISAHLSPRTSAYHEIWLDQKRVAGFEDVEPLYGRSYLPRKFKIACSIPPVNDSDLFAHCMGYIPILDTKTGALLGFNVSVGGGMGMTHNNKKTFPRIGEVMGFCTPDQALAVAEACMTTQRDYGDRVNRKHARMKYTIEDRGLPWFTNEVARRSGFKLGKARPYKFTQSGDPLGWAQGSDGRYTYTMFIENGRIKDRPGYPLMTGLREIAKVHTGDFRLTNNANLTIGDITLDMKQRIEGLFAKFKIGNKEHSGLRQNSMACAALPYCALAMAESERYLPSLITKLEDAIDRAGIRSNEIVMRMTGCPNGCARPYMAEIAFVGKGPGFYNLYLGGGHWGNRLNKLYRENVDEDQILNELNPLLTRYAKERRSETEWFGDWVIRAGVIAATKNGPDFHDNLQLKPVV